MSDSYTIEQIEAAFWKTFHKSGEIFFGYLGSEEENEYSTRYEWEDFLENLRETPSQVQAEKVYAGETIENASAISVIYVDDSRAIDYLARILVADNITDEQGMRKCLDGNSPKVIDGAIELAKLIMTGERA